MNWAKTFGFMGVVALPFLAGAAPAADDEALVERVPVSRVPVNRVARPVRPTPLMVTRADGGAVQTASSSGIVENKSSSLRREWLALHDAAMPVDFAGTPGVTTGYVSEPKGEHRYQVKVPLIIREALAAVEVRVLTFDVWGEHTHTLLLDELKDIEPGKRELSGDWRLESADECSRFHTSIAYVSRVRTRAGRIVEADPIAVVQEVRRVSRRFQENDLQTRREARTQ